MFIIPAALAYSLYSIPHLIFHIQHLEGASTLEAVALRAANALVALMGLALIALTLARDWRENARSPSVGAP